MKKKHMETALIHHGYTSEEHKGSLTPPLFQTSTFTFETAQQGEASFAGVDPSYIYSRLGNPTVKLFEERMAVLEGGEEALAFGSGMAAISATLIGFLKAGDHIICSNGLYGCTYGFLEVLEEKINHNAKNATRFIIVTNQKIFLKDATKISICFEGAHESGSLYHLLSHFIYNDLNMIKIESRPIEGRNWEYCFFVDFEGNMAVGAVKNAIRGLREEARNLKILGNY